MCTKLLGNVRLLIAMCLTDIVRLFHGTNPSIWHTVVMIKRRVDEE